MDHSVCFSAYPPFNTCTFKAFNHDLRIFFFPNKPLAWNLMTLPIEKKYVSDLDTRMSLECYIKI